MKKEVVSKPKVSKMEEVGLWLDGYSDLFSDFDSRPYLQRSLSFDFLAETKRAGRDKFGKVKLNLFIPKKKRNTNSERDIKKRLYNYFNKHFLHEKQKARGVLKRGLMFAGFGILLMFVATYLLFHEGKQFFLNFIIVLMEPGGWFLFWEGLNLSIFESKETKPLLEFYKKMSHCKIYFSSY